MVIGAAGSLPAALHRFPTAGAAARAVVVAVGAALHVAQLARAAAEVLVEMAVLERARHREARLPPLEELEVEERTR